MKARLAEGGDHHKYVVEGGAWWRHVESWKAERDGDHERVALFKKQDEQNDKLLAVLADSIRASRQRR